MIFSNLQTIFMHRDDFQEFIDNLHDFRDYFQIQGKIEATVFRFQIFEIKMQTEAKVLEISDWCNLSGHFTSERFTETGS